MSSHPLSRLRTRAALFAVGVMATRSAVFAGAPPVIDELVPVNGQNVPIHVEPRVPVGKALIFPVTVTDPDGGALTYTVTSDNPKVFASVRTGLPKFKMQVDHAGDGGADQQFSGTMEFAFMRDLAPVTSNYLSGFTFGHFYNNVLFHRVAFLSVPGKGESFIAQAGDPQAETFPDQAGKGGPGFSYENEFNPAAMFSGRGQLAMANSGYALLTYAASNGSQFFITDGSPRFLDFNHTIFGQLLRGWDTLENIMAVPRNPAPPGDTKVPTEDSPKVAVRITSAVIEPNYSDAILLISATAPGTAKIVVTVKDADGQTDTKQFTVTAYADTVNSPPFLRTIPNQTVAKEKLGNVPIQHVDLESDYCFFSARPLFTTSAQAVANGSTAYFLGNKGFTGGINVGVDITQYDIDYRGTIDGPQRSSDDQTQLAVAIGDKQIAASGRNVSGTPGTALTDVVVARYVDNDPAALPNDFSAAVIWGDGTFSVPPAHEVSSGDGKAAGNGAFPATISRDPSSPLPGAFVVTASHTYVNPGIYTVTVRLAAIKGQRANLRSTAVISTGPVRAFPRTVEVKGRNLTNTVLATFTDDAPLGLNGYSARVHWGDGQIGDGTIGRSPLGDFQVTGSHSYVDVGEYGVTVEVTKTGDSNPPALAWSRATLTAPNAPVHLPPFPVAHLIGQLGDAVNISNTITRDKQGAQTSVAAQLIIVNSGAKASTAGKIRFYLSEDKVTNTQDVTIPDPQNSQATIVTNPKDLLVKIGSLKEVSLPALQPGSGIRYVFSKGTQGDFRLKFPAGENGEGLNLLTHFEYSDPISDHLPIPHDLVVGPFAPIVVTPTSLTVQESVPAEVSKKFSVKLLRQPRANVVINVTLNATADAQVTVAPATLTFTSQNWNVAQDVTVTAKQDTVSDTKTVTVTVNPAVSTDIRFNLFDPADVSVLVKD